MFHDGDLQSGIAAAVQQSKAVLCFVHDDSETSRLWEYELLTAPETARAIQEHTIALKLEFASQETKYLTALCRISEAPTIVIIKDGQVQDAILPYVAKEEFSHAIYIALGLQPPRVVAGDGEIPELFRDEVSTLSDTFPPNGTLGAAVILYFHYDFIFRLFDAVMNLDEWDGVQLDSLGRVVPVRNVRVRRPSTNSSNSFQTATSSTSQRGHHEAQEPSTAVGAPTTQTRGYSSRNLNESSQTDVHSEAAPEQVSQPSTSINMVDTDTQAATPSAANGTVRNDDQANSLSSVESQRQKYIAEQQQREAAQKAERERIKKSIAADKLERRRRADDAQQQARPSASLAASPNRNTPTSPTEIRLAVRLLSGTSIRSSFPLSSTLSSTIRPWISTHLSQSPSPSDASIPYTFKLILAPQPNRTISISEEQLSLEDLLREELGNNALRSGVNFVMVPEHNYTDAYAGGSGVFGLVGSAAGAGVGLLGAVAGGVRNFFTGSSTTNNNNTADEATAAAEGRGNGNIRIRTMADQRARDQGDRQFYNGNTLNFQPRVDDDDEEEDGEGSGRKDE